MALTFRKQLQDEFDEVTAEGSKLVTKAAKEAWKTAVKLTKRDTGNAQSGWKLNFTRSSYVPRYTGSAKRRPKVPNIRISLRKHKRFVLYNNVPYINHLNDGGGRGNHEARYMLENAKKRFNEVIESGR